jgi:GMP synthase (glutamine-hydrolysing)
MPPHADDARAGRAGSIASHPDQPSLSPESAIHPEMVVILDFGSQFSMLIARRVRECNVYCELVPWNAPRERIEALHPRGFILSGGPSSVYDEGAPSIPDWMLHSDVPVLGICYGMQALAHQLGGAVEPGVAREYGPALVSHQSESLFDGMPASLPVWASHGDNITALPPGFRLLASSDNAPIAGMTNDRGMLGIQFHPEVVHTPQGKQILENFLYRVCGLSGDWSAGSFIEESIGRIRDQVGDGRVVCGLSGGVDSAVAAALIYRAIGDQLTCIFVDNGLLRAGEPEQVVETFRRVMGIPLVHVDAVDRFMACLAEVTNPETKRKRIGAEFIRVFEAEAAKLGQVDFIAQGTTYPDVVESAGAGATVAAVIKSHHNVGGLPENMKLKLVEPLRYLFKDEVRRVGLALGLPEEIVYRQPFPGPGLAIRVLGEVTPEKLRILRAADSIVVHEIRQVGLERELWQAFAVLTGSQTVGVMGDFRTYGYAVALRCVTAEDAMTADWARLPYDLLARISSRIVNEVAGVNRVVYDITSKPPGTIEWE